MRWGGVLEKDRERQSGGRKATRKGNQKCVATFRCEAGFLFSANRPPPSLFRGTATSYVIPWLWNASFAECVERNFRLCMPVALWIVDVLNKPNKNKLSKHVHRECCRLPFLNKPLFCHSLWKLDKFSYRLFITNWKYSTFFSSSSNKFFFSAVHFLFRQRKVSVAPQRCSQRIASFTVHTSSCLFVMCHVLSVNNWIIKMYAYRSFPYYSKMCKSNKKTLTSVGGECGKLSDVSD